MIVLLHILTKFDLHVFVLHGGLYYQLFLVRRFSHGCFFLVLVRTKYEKFSSFHDETVHYLEVPKEVLGKKFRGSSHGWLVSIEEYSPKISLFNPISRVQIALPPRSKFPDVRKYCAKKLGTEYALDPSRYGYTKSYFEEAFHVHEHLLDKIVLSSSPTSGKGKFMAAAIYGCFNNLAYCKLGDKKWTSTSICKDDSGFEDAIFYEDKLYAVTHANEMMVFDFSGAYPKKVETVEPPPIRAVLRRYLVNTSIGLLQVHRYSRRTGDGDNYRYFTSHFKLYMYLCSSRSWCEVKNIGENVLYLGLNTSISIACSDLPPGGYYKGNCIYFTDDDLDQHRVGVRGGYDIGVYDLDSGHTKFRHNNDKRYWAWLWPTPIWYIHSPEDFIME